MSIYCSLIPRPVPVSVEKLAEAMSTVSVTV